MFGSVFPGGCTVTSSIPSSFPPKPFRPLYPLGKVQGPAGRTLVEALRSCPTELVEADQSLEPPFEQGPGTEAHMRTIFIGRAKLADGWIGRPPLLVIRYHPTLGALDTFVSELDRDLGQGGSRVSLNYGTLRCLLAIEDREAANRFRASLSGSQGSVVGDPHDGGSYLLRGQTFFLWTHLTPPAAEKRLQTYLRTGEVFGEDDRVSELPASM